MAMYLRSCGLLAALSLLGCKSGGVGDPCTPEDEYQTEFSGYSVTEVNVESRSFQCETRVCLVNHFQGRVSCPYGQTEQTVCDVLGAEAVGCISGPSGAAKTGDAPDVCRVPGTTGLNDSGATAADDVIAVEVKPQLFERQAANAVYCSCRCDGPEENARYCECPSGFACVELVDDLGSVIGGGGGQLAGSYCIKDGTQYDPGESTEPCVGINPETGMAADPSRLCGNDGANPPPW